jgi:hypothetical protein
MTDRLQFFHVFSLFVFILFFSLGCTRTNEEYSTVSVKELMPLKIGNFITYRVDSLVFINGGKAETTRRYQMKHVVEWKTTDNLNRTTWRVNMYQNDSTASGPWILKGYYMVTPLAKSAEVIENDLRVIRLQLPVRIGFNWRGNSYLPDRPYSDVYATSVDENMDLWDFTYESIGQTEKIGSQTIPDVTTILHIDESRNVPMVTDTLYASREYSVEKYAKNIGLVYKELILWENQPRQRAVGTPPNVIITYDPVRLGFGVKMWMINKN